MFSLSRLHNRHTNAERLLEGLQQEQTKARRIIRGAPACVVHDHAQSVHTALLARSAQARLGHKPPVRVSVHVCALVHMRSRTRGGELRSLCTLTAADCFCEQAVTTVEEAQPLGYKLGTS